MGWSTAGRAARDGGRYTTATVTWPQTATPDDALAEELEHLGEPQTYGTQVRCRSEKPSPATLVDEQEVDALRDGVGLNTLAAYYKELAMMCANEEMEGQGPPQLPPGPARPSPVPGAPRLANAAPVPIDPAGHRPFDDDVAGDLVRAAGRAYSSRGTAA